jgi:hypothetical protein
MLCPSLSTDEIRRRVREAETLLRVATQHARDAREDPSKSQHASARIQTICREVEELFPGMHEPAGPDADIQAAMAQLQIAAPPGEDASVDAGAGDGADAGEDAGEAGPAEQWDVDYVKLGAAIENEELMSQFPEPARSAFKRAARYLVDSHERQELFSRVVDAFERLSELTAQNVEETHRKVSMAMTLEELAQRNKV